MRTYVWRGYLAVGFVIGVAAWVLPAVLPTGRLFSRIACYEVLSMSALVAVVVGLRWHRPAVRPPWLLFAASQLVYFSGDVTFYTYQNILHNTAFPAPADALYLSHYPLTIAGLWWLLRRRSPGGDRAGMLDALIITTGVGLLAWVFILGPYVRLTDLSLAVRLVSLAYPLMDLLVLAVAARLAISRGARPPAYWLLLAGLLGLLTADFLYSLSQLNGTYQTGRLLDAGWLAFYLGLGGAALHPSMRAMSAAATGSVARMSWVRFLAVSLAALVAPAVLLFQTTFGQTIDGPVIALVSAVLFGLTLVRMRGLSAQAATQAERSRLLGRLTAIIDASPVAIVELDRGGRVQLWNPAAERMYGWRTDDVLGKTHPAGLEEGWSALPTDGRGSGPATIHRELRQIRSDGAPIDVELAAASLHSPTGETTGMIAVAADITERKRLAEQLRHQALHDPLTGLANRALLRDRVEHAVARLETSGGRLAVLLLDLDGFKNVNDSLGHETGDQLLTLVAERLPGAVRAGDTVARFGGDEFVVLLEDVAGPADAVAAARRLLDALAEPVRVANREVPVHASIGITMAGAGAKPGDLVRDADVAMYRAKAGGGNDFQIFDPSMRAAVLERADLEADLRHALDRDEFRVRYQPIVDLRTGRITGNEALVRWQHPTRGLLAPGSFVSLAEETGQLLAIGAWVLRTACEQTRRWQLDVPGCEALRISVNLSAIQLAQPRLAADVAETLRTTGLAVEHLTLELTESLLIANVDATALTLTELDRLGVRLAIDDFGTGYSSLAYLRSLPVDRLKIDKAFVDDVAHSPDAVALVEAIVRLADTFGLSTVAEGIERPDQLERLRDLGCQNGQGYYFAKPLDEEAAGALLAGQPFPQAHAVTA